MEAHQSLPHTFLILTRAVRPRPMFVPDEVMENCCLDGQSRPDEIMHSKPTSQCPQRGELDQDAQSANEVEGKPAPHQGSPFAEPCQASRRVGCPPHRTTLSAR